MAPSAGASQFRACGSNSLFRVPAWLTLYSEGKFWFNSAKSIAKNVPGGAMAGNEELAKNESELLRVEAGRVIFREGDPGDMVYVVLDGEVELHVNGHLVETVGPGGILGEM